MSSHAWAGDWYARVRERVRTCGYDSLTAFAESQPTATMLHLADALGADVAPVQLETILRDEAIQANRLRPFAQALLCRHMRDWLSDGWGRGEDFLSDLSGAFARWEGGVSTIMADGDREIVWTRLQQLDVMPGWLPSGPDDPIIGRAFAGVRIDAPVTEG